MRCPLPAQSPAGVAAWSLLLVTAVTAAQEVAHDPLQRATVILAPRRQAVLSAEVPGRIARIHKELGQAFADGDVLLQLDELVYQAARTSAEAKLAAATEELAQAEQLVQLRSRERHALAKLAAAQANLKATQRLHDSGQTSAVELANAERDATVAETECELVAATTARELIKARRDLGVARGELDLAADELAACTMAAPYAGRVARVLVHEHEWVQRGTPLLEIVDDQVLRAKFLLPSRLFQAVALGQTLTLRITETGEDARAQVSHIAAVLDPASVTFEVYAELDNAAGRYRAGMNGVLSLAELRGP